MSRRYSRRPYRRRSYRGRGKDDPAKIAFALFVLFAIAAIGAIVQFVEENMGTILLILALLVVCAVLWFIFKKYRHHKFLENLPVVERVLLEQLDAFKIDIPRGARHAEALYQVSLGTYLHTQMAGHKVEYEKEGEGVRPDIVIDNEIAVEIKAMKYPKDRSSRDYNKQHVESIYKKSDLYPKQFKQVIFVIFNAGYVNDKNWRDYEDMKKILQEKNLRLVEK